ncbi:TonB-dependent receptor [Arenibacter sp. GZD96]|uniref:TonB-dependent receptor n=1 Tax=Aurantibrevibacter litoralis TaxID=3106030 RepID=UPI002AFE33EE|nr:TonB-dependent receptor [Arenibacter sp. GZD-96]MEA1786566.1 TonB-dependent receptor [Arenibacter sp. GZD-96]
MQKIFFSVFFLFFGFVWSQQCLLLDAETGMPISDAAIYVKDRSKMVLTDGFGRADLSIFKRNEEIIINHIGYELYITNRNKISRSKGIVYLTLKPEVLNEVVLSVSKWEQQRKNIPQKIGTIEARDASFGSPQTAADLLQNSGKVFVQRSQLGGGSPMIRGFSTNRLLIAVDGVRMNNAIFRGGNLHNVISIDPFTIKKTEIIFGPGSVIYGSDAIGGVMNFYTQTPQFSRTDSLVFSGNSTYRFASANSENTVHLDFNFGWKKWALLSHISYTNFEDLRMGKHGPQEYLRKNYVLTQNGVDILAENKNPRVQVPSGYNQINLLQKLSFKPNNAWNYNLGLHYSETSDFSRYDRLIRPDREGTGLRSAEWNYGPQKWFLGNLQIVGKNRGNFYDGVKLTTAYQRFEESRMERNFQDPNRLITREKVDAISTNIDFENKRTGNFRFYYGGEYIFNKVSSEGLQRNITTGQQSGAASRYPDGATWQTMAAYLNTEYSAKPNLTFLSGVRYSHVFIDATFDKTFFPLPFDNANLSTGAFTGSIGLSWFPTADLQITWNGATGFRAPNIDDVGKIFDSEPGAVVVPNPNLEPEYAYTTELGVRKNFKDKVVVKGTVFYTYLVDALVRRDFQLNGQNEIQFNGELSRVQAIQNLANAYVYGLEFGMDVFLSEHLSVASNITITQGEEEEEDGTDSPGRHVAPTFADLHLIWKNQKLKADIFLNYNGEISFENMAASERSKPYIYAINADGNPYSPSWYTLNFRSQYQISNALRSTVSLENLTSQRYRPYSSGIVSPGTNLILGIAYRF